MTIKEMRYEAIGSVKVGGCADAKVVINKLIKNPTRHKLDEAYYFLSKMRENFEDDKIFQYNLSAFLNAERNITFYLQKQYGHCKDFYEWYDKKQHEMKQDKELRFFIDARNEDVKEEPIKTIATRLLTKTMSYCIVKNGKIIGENQGEYPSAQDNKEKYPKTVYRYFTKYRDIDMLAFCENQLDKLSKIIDECENKYGNT